MSGTVKLTEMIASLTRERDEARAEVERLAKCCTQRGARMQILWGWIKGKHSHEAFLQCYPNAKKWFDEDGVPND